MQREERTQTSKRDVLSRLETVGKLANLRGHNYAEHSAVLVLSCWLVYPTRYLDRSENSTIPLVNALHPSLSLENAQQRVLAEPAERETSVNLKYQRS